jgi:hypothetical protein
VHLLHQAAVQQQCTLPAHTFRLAFQSRRSCMVAQTHITSLSGSYNIYYCYTKSNPPTTTTSYFIISYKTDIHFIRTSK